jgi:hypothetical protein
MRGVSFFDKIACFDLEVVMRSGGAFLSPFFGDATTGRITTSRSKHAILSKKLTPRIDT